MDTRKPQYLGTYTPRQKKMPSGKPKQDVMQLLNHALERKKPRGPVLSDEAARQIAMVLKGILKKK